MKSLRPPVILLLSSFLLGGCYSQLRFLDVVQNRLERDPEDVVRTPGKVDLVTPEGSVGEFHDAGKTDFHPSRIGYAPADVYRGYGFGTSYRHDSVFYPYSSSLNSVTFDAQYASSGTVYWVCWDPWDDLYFHWPRYYPSIAVSSGHGLHAGVGISIGTGRYARRITGTDRVTSRRNPVNRSGDMTFTSTLSGERSLSERGIGILRTRGTTGVRRSRSETTLRSRSVSGNRSRMRSAGRSASGDRSREN